MTQSQTGKWVSRVGSTGGGRNYRSRRPINFYGVLTLIVVLGLISVLLARNSYRTSSSSAPTIPPLVNTTQFSALGFDICGTVLPSLPAGPGASSSQLGLLADGVVRVAPTSAAYAGANASIAKLAAGYPGLTITTASLVIPTTATGSGTLRLTNGSSCPKGTPDAGQSGTITFVRWVNFASTSSISSIDPTALRFTANSLMTVAFLPSGKNPQKPSQTTINQMLISAQSGSTTPTTAPTVSRTLPVAPTTTTTLKK